MKYCIKCGAEVLDNSKFCEKCGNEINEVSSGKTGKRAKFIFVGGGAALVLAVVIILAGIGNKNNRDLAQEASADTNEGSYEISDEDMYNAEDIFTDTEGNTEMSGDEQGVQTGENVENPDEAVLTSSSTVNSADFVSEVKLNREQIRTQNKASLLELINNVNLTEEQKQEAVNAMVAMTDIGEREAAAEMLLEAKGFTDVVVSITDGNADVVLDMEEVTDEKRAEIEDIVKRKTNVEAQNIVITPIQGLAETSEADFVSGEKLNREQIHAQNKASLLELINNGNITEEQKQEAVDAMVAMTDIAEREAAAEMLLQAKGFTNVVVSITDGNADVVLDMGEVTDAKRAQIEDIVTRKTNIEAQNIVITPIQGSAETES